ncbi:MAG: sulfatase-like hydrolase/transferase [Planctomycetaceae bacterium]|nr:sulfatase-like hydrolase/transferase [Planctomycetaceae bacterium]
MTTRFMLANTIGARLLTFIVVAAAALIPATELLAAKPNVLIFYADDLGWGETGAYGCKDIPTPHIDSLAQNGVRFTQGYVAATYCSPSRAGLMTGRYPTRFGHEFNATARHSGLSLKETTLANRLKELGYATCAIGKWHLGGDASQDYYPTKRGFDEFYGTINNTPFYHPTQFVDSRKSLDIQKIDDESFYTTDKYAERAVDWLERSKDKPWFLYLPFNAQHAPLQAPQKYLDRFPEIKDEKRKIFAAMMSAMDDAIGQVLAKVRSLGQEDNTMIYFIGDNGGPTLSTTSFNGGLRGYKTMTYEGGPRVPYILQWKGKLAGGKVETRPVFNLDVTPTVVAAAGGTIDPAAKLDGVDLIPYLTGANTGRPHEQMFWRFGTQWAARSGDWKLVVARGGSGSPELYNLADDPNESKDLASADPAKVAQLQKLYDAWNAEQAPPSAVDNPNKQAKKKGAAKKGNAKKKAAGKAKAKQS